MGDRRRRWSAVSTSSMSTESTTCAPPVNWPVDRSAYNYTRCIGQGATSVVYEAQCGTNDRRCAVKVVNLEKCSNSASLDEIDREIKSMRNLKHNNVVAYHVSFVSGPQLSIVMDLCERGSLLDLIKATQKKRDITTGVFDETVIATILRDVLRGLAYIHENGLVHRDLKCGNLLVRDDGVVRIADFGVAGFLHLASCPLSPARSLLDGSVGNSTAAVRYTFVGTPCWMAPEVMQQQQGYNQKADIWSLGITAIELATGQAPYAKYSPMKVLMLTMQSDPPDIDSVSTTNNQYSSFGHKFRKFSKVCLTKVPENRPSARQLLNHSFIKSKAKDRELLCRVLLSGIIPPPSRSSRDSSPNNCHREHSLTPNNEWNFDEASDFSEWCSINNQQQQQHQNPVTSSDSDEEGYPVSSPSSSNQRRTSKSSDPGGSQSQGPNSAEPIFNVTLRKRNPQMNNELQDISFVYTIGKDTSESLAHELVEAGLVDGTDYVLVAHNLNEIIDKPTPKERTFPLNSSPGQGQIPAEKDLYGYAKILITPLPTDVASESSGSNQSELTSR